MVGLAQKIVEEYPTIKNTCKSTTNLFTNNIPTIDLKSPSVTSSLLQACEEYGFFKVINHGVSIDLTVKLEEEAVKFFQMDQSQKDNAGPANPLGYGSKKIGPNGDVGWIEYLMFSTNPVCVSKIASSVSKDTAENFRTLVNDYTSSVREMVCRVLETIAHGLKIKPIDTLSRLLINDKSDSVLRLNFYPPCPDSYYLQRLNGRNLIGFAEHTDPQIISALRSNDTSGYQIATADGTWVSVPPDPDSFFLNVGDCLEVMTNGRFKSVKHRVLAESLESRVSMIYFGGPPLDAEITTLPLILEEGEESLYKEFTWGEYKKSAYKSKLGDNRLSMFVKNNIGK